MALSPAKIRHAVGCGECHDTGYSGRTGLFEVWRVDDEFKQMILEHVNERELRRKLHQRGIGPLAREGIEKAIEGVTSIEDFTRSSIRL